MITDFFLVCRLVRYSNLDLVAQIPVTGNVNRLSQPLIQNRMFRPGVWRAGWYGQLSSRLETDPDGKDEPR